MMGISSKCRVGLCVAKHHSCVGTENEGGFSPRYVLLSFQNLTYSSRQLQLTTLNLIKATSTPWMQTEENPHHKGGWLEIGPARRGGMNQNTPNPGLALEWPHYCLPSIEWDGRTLLRMNLRSLWYWTLRSGCQQRRELRKATSYQRHYTCPRWEYMTMALGWTEEWADFRYIK